MTDAAWVALSLTERIGRKTLEALLRYFDGDLHAILAADSATLQQVSGVGPKIAASIQAINLPTVEKALTYLQQVGVQISTLYDSSYPVSLRRVVDAPPTVFMRGRWRPEMDRAVAIVGTREPAPENAAVARRLAYRLAQQGYTIVSGLATGIDTAAHLGALEADDGLSVAVLGCGLLNVYPQVNRTLAQQIMTRGVVLCEVHPDAPANAASPQAARA